MKQYERDDRRLTRRTFLVIFGVWLVMVGLLTSLNREAKEDMLQRRYEDNQYMLSLNVEAIREAGTLDPDAQRALLTWYATGYFDGVAMATTRIYNEDGFLLARSPLSYGAAATFDDGAYDLFVDFDAVLTRTEQLALARLLRDEGQDLVYFHGPTSYGETGDLYGEVTGILNGTVIYPQKVVYHRQSGPVTLMESGHEMFNGVPLTTVRFDAFQFRGALLWGGKSPEELLELYDRAHEMLDEMDRAYAGFSDRRASGSKEYKDGFARFGWVTGVSDCPVAYSYAYYPFALATQKLWPTYVLTFLCCLFCAWYLSAKQRRSLRRERELTRAVTHSFKTPAAVVRAYAEALREDIAPEKREEYLDTLISESDRMGTMVSQLLEMARLEGSRRTLVREEVELHDVVHACFERLRLPMQERGLELHLELAEFTCRGDRALLEQAVDNLALNVLHHATPGPVEVKLSREGTLTVENRCDPLPPLAENRLWEPFYQPDGARERGGSGLGLAIVAHVVELHGGRRSARPTDTGLRITVTLPGG